MSTHEGGTSTATTPSERSVRIAALAFDANREYLQVLLELGAKRAQELNEMASGPTFDAGVLRLAGPGRRVGTYAEADIAPFPVRGS